MVIIRQLIVSVILLGCRAAADYVSYAEAAAETLQQWYNTSSGLWVTTGWWNSANCLTILADLAAVDKSFDIDKVAQNTFVQAQKYNLEMTKMYVHGWPHSYYWPHFPPEYRWGKPSPYNPKGFLNGFYDDEGWWALAWIQVYDDTHNQQYLQAAEDIFNDMKNAWTTPCNGGIWWDRNQTYVNAIANELFLSVGAHLANRASDTQYYLEWAQKEWDWFYNSGMINSENTINDGLTDDCQNNGGIVWSYNVGVILGGLLELSKATKNESLVDTASTIAFAGIANLTDSNGILHDQCEPDCGADGSQFKGVFLRNVQLLQQATGDTELKTFIEKNADSIWANDRNARNELSVDWDGPFIAPANASTQSSALDCLVAAAAVG